MDGFTARGGAASDAVPLNSTGSFALRCCVRDTASGNCLPMGREPIHVERVSSAQSALAAVLVPPPASTVATSWPLVELLCPGGAPSGLPRSTGGGDERVDCFGCL
eukprot:CAMPEP_0181173100 /NCGR_PEP_ID=MMETSP1096-20121128/2809_1 /TAXON_ID=156174 ORGANISM="Chrysochromulina ericina, Strain CCMP281" /NCGR_SAMPLE_ID=MMETSP1096 /ASSEMBLY_ACC=CAM_ASM_000453 /LENGTH=105 /DNA_ID=CAMNT_0023260885 /DNA_START=467 /DNA_END=782 /DNA_ORIENTATION=-